MAARGQPPESLVGVMLDACLSPRCAESLRAEGFDVDYAGDWPAVATDDEIMQAAAADSRVVVTLDKDFGELAVAAGMRHFGIVRLENMSAARHAATCAIVLRRYRKELADGGIVTVSPGRVRVRSGG